jgi:hypothetical protein
MNTPNTTGRKGLGIPPATLEKEKAPESREPSIKFKLPSLHFSPSRRR